MSFNNKHTHTHRRKKHTLYN